MSKKEAKVIKVEYVIGRDLGGDIICTHYLPLLNNKPYKNNYDKK